MEMPRTIGMEVKAMSNLFKRQLDRRCSPAVEDAPTGVQGMVLHFLIDHCEDRDIFQRDVEALFSMRRPTATGVLQLMEKNGLILRQPVEHDARLKRLVPTPKARQFHTEVTQRLHEVEELALRGLSAEEIEQFFRLADKIKQNLSDTGPFSL